MEDLFAKEQQILEEAASYLECLQDGAPCDAEKYALLTCEYGRLLKQLRRITKISDRTAKTLNLKKLDLQGKVNYDVMTGLYSRRFLEDNLSRVIADMSSGGWLSVLMMDIDFFKSYNDAYGHSTGDDCLREVAAVLLENIKTPGSFVARYGGEEFIAVLPDIRENAARGIADDILQAMCTRRIPHEDNTACGFVTISIGGTCGFSDGSRRAVEFVEQADRALYQSKQTGRARYTFLGLGGERDVTQYT